MRNGNTLRALEFNRILEAIAGFAHSDATKKAILKLCPLDKKETLEKRFGLISDIQSLNEKGISLKLTSFNDITPYTEKLKPDDSILEAAELYSFVIVLGIISDISVQINKADGLPLLKDLIRDMWGFPEILKSLIKSVNADGNILDSASPSLSRIRADIRSLEKNIKKRLEDKMADKNVSPFIQDAFIAQRTGRWVIPIRMDSRGQVPGVVHDISRSGETAFIEPLEIIGPANELENLLADEKSEEIRILKALSRSIRDVKDEFYGQFKTIVHLDLLNSIAMLSRLIKSEIPQIGDSLYIKLVRARHPILALMRKDNVIKDVVPLDLQLGGESRVMVITGPNAGGKTIAIKTVGLSLLMALCGIPVPADSSSVFPLVGRLLVDIGDEQSIEASLSTFSAHVSKIAEILKSESANTVVLLDELGTGTEPSQGSAIACAVLKDLSEKGNLVFATTHLMEIVGFVQTTGGMLNASMEFDSQNHAPLYKLRTGEPGESHALETAMRFGLPEPIINSAKTFLGRINIELYELIADLREKRQRYEAMIEELEDKKKELGRTEMLLQQRSHEIEKQKKETERNAYISAEEMIRETKQKMHALLDEAKRKERNALRKAEKIHHEVAEKLRALEGGPPIPFDEIKIGGTVFVKSIGYDAVIKEIDIKKKRLKVGTKGMEVEIPISDITAQKGIALSEKGSSSATPEREVVSRIDLIGLRVDEAISRLEPFLNDAALAGIEEVVIVHGVGTGALLKAVHKHLSGHPLIKEFRHGEQKEGGRGVTIVKLR